MATTGPRSSQAVSGLCSSIRLAYSGSVVVHPANIQDRQGVQLLLGAIQGVFPRLSKVWVDSGYTGKGQEWIEQAMG